MRHILATTVLLFGLAHTAQADIYVSYDSKNEPHYSDTPTPGSKLVSTSTPRVPTPATSAPAATPNASGGLPPGLAASNARITANQAQDAAARSVQQDLAAKRAADCTKAKERYEKSIRAERIYTDTESGREFMTTEEADAVRVRNKLAVEQNCGPASR